MFDINLLLPFIYFFLVIIQSICGIGILVLGTPILLILKFNIIEIFTILLPISILTSLLNLVFFKINKKKLNMKIDKNSKNLFFLICVPSIFVGIILLWNFNDIINYNLLVSSIIIISFLLTRFNKIFTILNNKIRLAFLTLIGIVHGLTNSGGSILSLFVISYNKKNVSRYSITYFYFFLALFQFLIFLIFFKVNFNYFYNLYFFLLIPTGVFIGNYFAKNIDELIYKNLVVFLSLITSFFLIMNEIKIFF